MHLDSNGVEIGLGDRLEYHLKGIKKEDVVVKEIRNKICIKSIYCLLELSTALRRKDIVLAKIKS
jgi:hypothetical protein